ncbi:hypothetical protein P3T76_009996 [Phytophthora citrophthora]|uniref:Uncharacterized protein n=1 Tax=Phytophthora citrophthora TaxID=4793 RepID=A0AAD9LHK7_9STRA|nr:hypothetical protein P3T76_009996 [Phytophthora citrophthora]
MARTRGSRTTPSHNTPFQPGHPLKFGVEAVMLDTNGVVISAGCKFCRCFGRETAPEGQRKRTKNTKCFRVPFRPQNYKAHLASAHPEKWAQYDALPDAQKALYFPDGDLLTAVVVAATSVKGAVSEENTMAVQPVEVPRTAPERNVAQIPMHPEVVTTGNANEIALPETHVDGRQNNDAEGKRKMEIFTADGHAPDATETKRRKLKESSDYVQSLFRTVGEMRAASCNELLVTKMLEEAERQAFNLVRESKLQLP